MSRKSIVQVHRSLKWVMVGTLALVILTTWTYVLLFLSSHYLVVFLG